ncbi:hypothetical protein [Sphingomonas sp. DC2300-3]
MNRNPSIDARKVACCVTIAETLANDAALADVAPAPWPDSVMSADWKLGL